MNLKYRTCDQSANIILSVKNSTYGPSKGVKFYSNNKSYKKMEPLNIKIFDRPKKNSRILSRNDRMDLFLEGGNFSETRKTQNKRLNDRSFYKMMKIKKKSQVFISLRDQLKINNQQAFQKTTNIQNRQISKSDYFNYLHSSDGYKNKCIQTDEPLIKSKQKINVDGKNNSLQNNLQGHSVVKIQTPYSKKRSVSRQKYKNKNQIVSTKNDQFRGQLKNFTCKSLANKVNIKSQNQLQKLGKTKKPLFYLQQKQINHIKSQSFTVTEFPSGQIIFGNYAKKSGEIASLTKIMTFYAVFQIAQSYSKNVSQQFIQIDEQAQHMSGTSAQIFVGDIYTIQQLFYGLMLPSGNDAATALAKWGGKILQQMDATYKAEAKNTEIKTFIKHMNVLAKNIGMKASKFCNPHGLPHPQAGSNAEQLAILISQCLKIDLFKLVIKTKKYKCQVMHKGIKHEVVWQNTNKLLRRPNFIGGKTGVTVTAGPCLASCYQVKDKIFITIILRTNKLSRRFKQTRQILALALSKIDKQLYRQNIKQLLRNDAQLDSDNSQQEMQFNYQRNDARQMAKRNKILTFEM